MTTIRILALSLLLPALAFGQTENFTITADASSATILPETIAYGITISANGESCELDKLFAAAERLRWALPRPFGEPYAETMIYRTPADELRHQANEMEARDKAIKEWREIEAKCSAIYSSMKQIYLEEKP